MIASVRCKGTQVDRVLSGEKKVKKDESQSAFLSLGSQNVVAY